MKLLIIDNDAENIRNFRAYIKSTHPDLKIAGTINDNTRSVIDVIKEIEPRLILADVRFFGAAGYNLLRGVNEQYPEVRFILYGTYNEGEYMARMLEVGAVDFMYKPVKSAELERCINAALDYFKMVDSQKLVEHKIEKSYTEQLFMFEDIFLKSLLNGDLREEKEIRYAFSYFNMDFDSGFTVFILRIDNYKKIVLTLDEKEKHLLIYKMLLITRERLKSKQFATVITGFNSLSVVLGGHDPLESIVELCDGIKNEIYDRTNHRVTIGIGRTYDSVSDISISSKEANGALHYRFHMGYNTVIPIHFVEPSNTITYRYPYEMESKLVWAAAIGEYQNCKLYLNEIFTSLKACGPLPDKLLSKIVMDIMISINRYISELNIPLQNRFTAFFPSKDALELKTVDAAHEYLHTALKNFCDYMVKYYEETNLTLFESAKQYTHERYYETFSISKIAAHLGTTPEYLNKLFYDRAQKTLYDYSMRVRFDEAKRLMRETDFDDEIVAVKVGYADGRHFRSVFKQHEGVNTNDYRAQYNIYSNKLMKSLQTV